MQSGLFFFSYIWYGIRIIRIYSGLLNFKLIKNQQVTISWFAFQVQFKLDSGDAGQVMFRIILGHFKNYPTEAG